MGRTTATFVAIDSKRRLPNRVFGSSRQGGRVWHRPIASNVFLSGATTPAGISTSTSPAARRFDVLKIFIIQLRRIGDVIVTTPVIDVLRRSFSGRAH
jgi:hypothetical protein